MDLDVEMPKFVTTMVKDITTIEAVCKKACAHAENAAKTVRANPDFKANRTHMMYLKTFELRWQIARSWQG